VIIFSKFSIVSSALLKLFIAINYLCSFFSNLYTSWSFIFFWINAVTRNYLLIFLLSIVFSAEISWILLFKSFSSLSMFDECWNCEKFVCLCLMLMMSLDFYWGAGGLSLLILWKTLNDFFLLMIFLWWVFVKLVDKVFLILIIEKWKKRITQ